MPKAPVSIPELRTPPQLPRGTIAYIEARLDNIAPAECLRRFVPQRYLQALDRAERDRVANSEALRREARALDRELAQLLALEARRLGLYGSARAFRMLPLLDGSEFDTLRLNEPAEVAIPARAAPRVPTLAELEEQYPDFDHNELMALLEESTRLALAEAAPARPTQARRIAPRPSRRQRVVRLQRRSLERLMAPRPIGHHDHLQALLPKPMWTRLEANGIATVHDLMVAVARDSHWYAVISGLGKTKAALIEDWLRRHDKMPRREPPKALSAAEATPALPVAGEFHTAPSAPSPAPVQSPSDAPQRALARLPDDPALDGSCGGLRVYGSKVLPGVNKDSQAIEAWLNTVKSPHTWRAYRREAVRLMLWCRLVRKVALSSMSAPDCAAYIEFLQDLPPDWCGAHGNTVVGALGWVPFDSKQLERRDQKIRLSERSIAYTFSVVNRLFRWLGDARYLSGNPWTLLPADSRRRGEHDLQVDHSLSPALIDDIMRELAQPPANSREARLLSQRRVLLALLFDAGVRREEAARLRYRDFEISSKGEAVAGAVTDLQMQVLGKGSRRRKLPVSEQLHRWMVADLIERQCPGDVLSPGNRDQFVLKGMHAHERQLHANSVYKRVASALEWLAKRFESSGRTSDAARLRQASTHWGRHSFAMRAVRVAPLEVVQSLLGHKNIQTTLTYTKVGEAQRFAAIAAAAAVADRAIQKPNAD